MKPAKVNQAEIAFGGDMDKLMPKIHTIPDEYEGKDKWESWQSDWFFSGLKARPTPKEGIDIEDAMRHLSAIQGSWEPKHEHKQAAVAYLASQWFKNP